ncbi:MAG: histidine kinase [Bacteroidota bacterium]
MSLDNLPIYSTDDNRTYTMNQAEAVSKTWKQEIKEILLIALIGIPSGAISCPSCMKDIDLALISISISSVTWVMLWKGNAYVSGTVDRFYYWLEQPVQRLVVGVIAHTIYTTLAVVLLMYVLETFFGIEVGGRVGTALTAVMVTLVVALILHSKSFLTSWREMAINSEKMKKEAISAKYESLKNQVNPHFLFNSLNALTNLVYEDQDLAAKFIKKLSEVYRYVLESRDKELVSLEDELSFVRSYIFLQKIRHEEGLQVTYEIQNPSNFKIVPLGLQMLLENAIKHNVVSDDDPLIIEIKEVDGTLIISNNLQKKSSIQVQQVGVGLENIKARYQFLSDIPVSITETSDRFEVILPLLKLN